MALILYVHSKLIESQTQDIVQCTGKEQGLWSQTDTSCVALGKSLNLPVLPPFPQLQNDDKSDTSFISSGRIRWAKPDKMWEQSLVHSQNYVDAGCC